MPIIVQPKWQQSISRGQTNSVVLQYVVLFTNSRDAAYAALEAETSDALNVAGGFLARTDISLDQTGPDLWDGSVTYGLPGAADRPERPEIGQGKRSFEIGFRTEKVLRSIDTRTYFTGSDAPPNFGGAIGVEKGAAKGLDVNTPTFTWAQSQIISLAQFNSDDYFDRLWQVAQAPVSSGSFYRFQAGEVLFLGATGGERDSESAEMNFRFTAARNLSGLSIGAITDIAKKAWEYLEGLTEDAEDADTVIRKVRAVYVHQVYYTSDFNLLGV